MTSSLLVGTDGSSSADVAVKRGVELAGLLGARLLVASVRLPSTPGNQPLGASELSTRRVGVGIRGRRLSMRPAGG